MSKPKYPFHIYVKEENDGGTKYFTMSEDLEELVSTGETVTIAKYSRFETIEVSGVVKIGK